jgi:predicted nuclease with TOPRIM domain
MLTRSAFLSTVSRSLHASLKGQDFMRHSATALRGGTLALAATLLFALPGVAQGPPMAQQQLPPEVEAMLAELDETQDRLEELQGRALAGSEALQAEQSRIQELVESTLRIVEPEYEALIRRFGELQQEAAAAQQSEDMEAFQTVMNEAQTIQMRLQTAQAQTFERDEVDTAVSAYREQLVDEMTRLDPEAPRLMDRMEELVERLEDIMG